MATYTYTPTKLHEGRIALTALIQAFSEQAQTTHRQLTEEDSDGEVVGDLFLEMMTDQVTALTRQLTLYLLSFNHTKSLGHAAAARASNVFTTFTTLPAKLEMLGMLDEVFSPVQRDDGCNGFPGDEGGEAIDLAQPRAVRFKLTIPKDISDRLAESAEKLALKCKKAVADAAMDEQAGMAAFERIEAMVANMTDDEIDLLRSRIKVIANDRFFARMRGPGGTGD
ncbi:hypothetical protein D3C87_687450 [compost metagenome]